MACLLVLELAAISLAVTNLLITPAYAAGGQAITRALTSSADADLQESAGTTNTGTATTMRVRGQTNGNPTRQRSVVSFDLSTIPTGASSITSTMTLNNSVTSSRTVAAHKITTAWVESTVIWNAGTPWTTAGGDFNATATATAAVAVGNMSFTVTTDVCAFVSGSGCTAATNNGWLLKDNAEANNVGNAATFSTLNAASNKPSLSVTFTAVWDSYNNSARTVQDDTFAGASENQVYMRGTGYNLGGSYVVGYYDSAGDKRCTEVVPAAAGTLDSTCPFRGSAAAGLWHAVAFEPGITAPATYATISQDTHKVVGDDTFTVQSSAITPELPSIIAAVVVGMASIATFWWFARASRRRQAA